MIYEFKSVPVQMDGTWAENDDAEWQSFNTLYQQNWELAGITRDDYAFLTGHFQRREAKESTARYEFMTITFVPEALFQLGENNWHIAAIFPSDGCDNYHLLLQRKLPKGVGGLYA